MEDPIAQKQGWKGDLFCSLWAVFGLFILNILLTTFLWLPEYEFIYLLRIAPEALCVFAILIVLSSLRTGKNTLFLHLLSVFITIYFIFGLGETVTRHLYRRGFNPWIDLSFFGEVLRLLSESGSIVLQLLYLFTFIILIAAVFTGVRFLLLSITKRVRGITRQFFAFTIVVSILVPTVLFFGFGEFFIDNMYKQIKTNQKPDAEQFLASEEAGYIPNRVENTREKEFRLPGLKDCNVLLFIVESYGYTAYKKEDHFQILEPVILQLESRLTAHGYTIRSNFLRSPVIGGYSWLADMTLLTGILVNSQQKYDELIVSDQKSLVDVFNDAGYLTVLSAPGTLKDWPEGESFFSFDHYFYAKDFQYKGPEFSFVPVPDQFSIQTIHEKVLNAAVGPLYVQYLLVSSHAPFNKIPAYVNDWDRIGDGSIYFGLNNLTFQNTWFSGKEYTEGYTAAIEYVLTVITEYLSGFIKDETFVIIVGDHQPKFPVTERSQPLSVPIHLISKNEMLVGAFNRYGYSKGFVPRQSSPHQGLETFFSQFLDVISDVYFYNTDW